MAGRLPTLLPRLAALVLVALGATAGITFAAGSQVPSAPAVPTVSTTPAAPLIVPDVRNQAFVFAKGTLTDAGFAWRVVGSVHGYAANVVTAQSPAAGTPVADTGAPLITLTLRRNGSYTESGQAADTSPYPGTAVVRTDLAGNPIGPAKPAAPKVATPTTTTPAPAAAAHPATAPPATALQTTTATPTTSTATTATTATATTGTTATTTAAPTGDVSPAAAAAKAAKAAAAPATAAAAPTAKTAAARARAAWPASRPAAFVVAGARKEPLDEMPLPDRAAALGAWLDAHPTPSAAREKYWLYQNAWVVTGAKFGWWHGADALRMLIAVDRRTERLWGIGATSAAVAEQALIDVEARSK